MLIGWLCWQREFNLTVSTTSKEGASSITAGAASEVATGISRQ